VSVPAYADYKDSGVPWLGGIPVDWQVERFRHVFRESPEKIESEVVGPMLSVSGYRGIEIKDYDDENRRRLDEDLIGYRVVRPGQLVVNTMWLNYAGLGVSSHEGHVSPAYRSYWIERDVDRRYIHHLMRSAIYVQGYTRLLTGIRPNSLQISRDDLMDFPVILPPRADQAAIATFLDRETAKIDALVAEQERLIALLKEKRQAWISHAVTKGLNPNAPMKDSGIEWLGEIPAHWEVVHLRRLVARIEQGWSPECESREAEEGEWGVLKAGCVNRGVYRDEENKALPSSMEPISSLEVSAGDVLMSRASGNPDLVGSCAFIESSRPHLLLSDKIFRIHLRVTAEPRWFAYAMASSYVRVQIRNAISGADGLANNLPQSALRSFLVPLPPIAEQMAINLHIASISAQSASLIAEAQSAITLLQERRAALISAAVTGKIDVRGLVQTSQELELA
jgi:type I restriction enzyme S subunit